MQKAMKDITYIANFTSFWMFLFHFKAPHKGYNNEQMSYNTTTPLRK